MQIILGLVALLLIAPLIAVLAQEWRYHRKRRDIVMDRQHPFHDKSAPSSSPRANRCKVSPPTPSRSNSSAEGKCARSPRVLTPQRRTVDSRAKAGMASAVPVTRVPRRARVAVPCACACVAEPADRLDRRPGRVAQHVAVEHRWLLHQHGIRYLA